MIDRFEIIVRNLKRVRRLQAAGEESWKEHTVSVNTTHLDEMIKRINEFGFINFYGEQRVGDSGSEDYVGVRSFDVGKAMLKQDFAKAIDLIMIGRSKQVYNPSPEEVEARDVWKKTRDARQTLSLFPKNTSTMTRERDLMKGMLRYDDALQAIRCVHHNVRMFWIHAYQSFVWNRVASERVKRWGIVPVIGDLYQANENSGSNASDVQVVVDPTIIDLYQIVLPLPGYNVEYPTNEIGHLYKTILAEDGITLSKDMIPEATAKGSYRKLFQRAHSLRWESVNKTECGADNISEVVSNAKFTFELESGSYATMLLRELMVTTMARDSKAKE